MKDIIKISWDSGYYALVPEKFFPTTMEKTRKVFKLMIADPAWGDAEINELLAYFAERRKISAELEVKKRSKSVEILSDCRFTSTYVHKNSPAYENWLKQKQEGQELAREATKHKREVEYFTKAVCLLCDMRVVNDDQ